MALDRIHGWFGLGAGQHIFSASVKFQILRVVFLFFVLHGFSKSGQFSRLSKHNQPITFLLVLSQTPRGRGVQYDGRPSTTA